MIQHMRCDRHIALMVMINIPGPHMYVSRIRCNPVDTCTSSHVVTNSQASPLRNIQISAPPSLEQPYSRSTKMMGTSAILAPIFRARTIISIWKAYPRDVTSFTTSLSSVLRYRRNDPVESDTCMGITTTHQMTRDPLDVQNCSNKVGGQRNPLTIAQRLRRSYLQGLPWYLAWLAESGAAIWNV